MEPEAQLERIRRTFEIEIQELQRLADNLDPGITHGIDLIRNSLLNGGKIVVAGVGKNSHIGDKIAATFTSTGSPAIALHIGNALHGDLGIVREQDVILALSYSGETEELLNLLPAFKRFNVPVIGMTGNPRSTLARYSDLAITIKVENEACPLGLAPTSSTTAMLVMGDALAMVLLEISGFREEHFARFHPGGSLGRKLLVKAADIMRPGEEIVIIQPGETVGNALEAMTIRRAGAAIIVNPSGELHGIFTHGDFVRAFRKEGGDVASSPVSDFMSLDPVRVKTSALAAEVLGILKLHKIDEIIVVDENLRPAGLIDVQDLSRLKLW